MATKSLASVDATCFQQPNPPGLRKIFACVNKDIVGSWPNASILDAEEINVTEVPTMVVDKTFAQFVFPDGTAETMFDKEGDPSYQTDKHGIEFALAGSSDSVRAEVRKFLNAGAVFLVEEKDGSYSIVGSTDDPVYITHSFRSGKGGTDKKGYTLTGSVDGMAWGQLKISKALVETMVFEAVPAA
ncbi:unnamed protein product [Chrysoparadoxa australica]